ncbi:hypothetical protein [Deinococcus sp.]|uniref:hypothetical protein n=1 Tax=Deinococcus sp. TaxID=47478 RepID=UPI0025F5FF0F|nr:hypothetical protein [Deinococcus sp.]
MTRNHIAFALVLVGLSGVTVLAVLTLPFVFGTALQMAYGQTADDSTNLQATLGFWGWVLSIAMIVVGMKMKS